MTQTYSRKKIIIPLFLSTAENTNCILTNGYEYEKYFGKQINSSVDGREKINRCTCEGRHRCYTARKHGEIINGTHNNLSVVGTLVWTPIVDTSSFIHFNNNTFNMKLNYRYNTFLIWFAYQWPISTHPVLNEIGSICNTDLMSGVNIKTVKYK